MLACILSAGCAQSSEAGDVDQLTDSLRRQRETLTTSLLSAAEELRERLQERGRKYEDRVTIDYEWVKPITRRYVSEDGQDWRVVQGGTMRISARRWRYLYSVEKIESLGRQEALNRPFRGAVLFKLDIQGQALHERYTREPNPPAGFREPTGAERERNPWFFGGGSRTEISWPLPVPPEPVETPPEELDERASSIARKLRDRLAQVKPGWEPMGSSSYHVEFVFDLDAVEWKLTAADQISPASSGWRWRAPD
jgi:hypothetical protein